MRFLLRVDSHARNHSAHPQAQSQVWRRSAPVQRRAPRVSLGATCGRRRALHQPCARELGRAQLGRPLYTTTTGHMHRGAALELRCSGVWS